MTIPGIRQLVPHAGPMVLLDRVLEADDNALCAAVAIDADSMFYSAGAGGVGSWVGVEYMAQAIAAHAGYLAWRAGRPVRVGFLLGARKYSTAAASFPAGSTLYVRAALVLRGENGLSAFDCSIALSGEAGAPALATATLTVFQPEDVDHFLQENQNGTTV
jgi:predicted hotdog family 3-hydroxylacyl-ACP dehydratase